MFSWRTALLATNVSNLNTFVLTLFFCRWKTSIFFLSSGDRQCMLASLIENDYQRRQNFSERCVSTGRLLKRQFCIKKKLAHLRLFFPPLICTISFTHLYLFDPSKLSYFQVISQKDLSRMTVELLGVPSIATAYRYLRISYQNMYNREVQ